MSIATVERSRATFRIKRGLRFSHCYFIRAVHSAPEKVAFAPVKFSRCFGRCFRSAFRLALCARTVYAVVHKSFALSALYGSHRTRARHAVWRSWGVPPWSVSIIARVYPLVNPFFKKIFEPVFFKDNENARARSGSQNRRKQAKTWVLNAEKFFEKIRKSAQKNFFRRAARLFFEIFALCPADLSHPVAPSVPPI